MNKKTYHTISKLVYYFIGILSFIILGVLLFGKEAILIIVNPRYYDAIPLVGFLIMGVYFNGLITLSNSILGYKNKFGTISKFALIGSVVFVFMCVFLIPKFGALGAAISYAISYSIFFILGVWNQRETIIIIIQSLKGLIPIFLVIFMFILNYSFSFYFDPKELSLLEIILKLSLLIITIVVLFYFKIFTRKDFIKTYKIIIDKYKRTFIN